MSVDEWWPKKKVKGNKRRRHVVTFWELLIVWKMRLRFSFFFSIARCTCIYILFRFLSSPIQSGAVCDRNPPRSLLNGCDLLTLCLDMSRFSSFLQLTVGQKKKKEKRASAEGERERGAAPGSAAMDCHPRFSLYWKERNKRRKRVEGKLLLAWAGGICKKKKKKKKIQEGSKWEARA